MTGPNGQTHIRTNTSELTCYDKRCLEINLAARSVQFIGDKTTRIPGNIDVSSSAVTPVAFRQIAVTASLAGGVGSGQDRD